MKKKWAIIVAAVVAVCSIAVIAVSIVGCKGPKTDSSSDTVVDDDTEQVYTVTFMAEGEKVGEMKVKGGEVIDGAVPSVYKAGYDVSFSVDLSAVAEDLTVNATVSPKTYKITYDLGNSAKYGSHLDSLEQTVVYGEECELRVPEMDDNYSFNCWKLDGKKFENGKWTLTKNVTLVASYSSNWTGNY